LVVDNGSTDGSHLIIDKLIEGDEHFKLVRNSENLGQLGAFFGIYKQLNGDFIVNLDADDMLFPDFIATHVQSHLALSEPVALTSSDVTVIDKDEAVLMHGYRARNKHQPDSTGLLPPNKVPRIAEVSDDDYRQIDSTISAHNGPVGWIWGPGTSNMYRRSVLDMVYERPKQRAWMRSADNFLNPLSHALQNTALIDQELSAYRVHAKNNYGTISGSSGGRRDKATRDRQMKDFYETTDSVLRRAKHYEPILGEKYWDLLRTVSNFISPPSNKIMPGSPDTIDLLKRNYDVLCKVFSKPILQQQLPVLFMIGDIYQATGQTDFKAITPTRPAS
jgi:glycosyltransferase involved in cell wall biosynthesis